MKTEDTTLIGLDISGEMVALARKNARDYGLEKRAEYHVGDAGKILAAIEEKGFRIVGLKKTRISLDL